MTISLFGVETACDVCFRMRGRTVGGQTRRELTPIPLATQRVVQTMNIAVRGSNRSAQVQNAVTTTTARVPDATSAPITPRTRWTNIDADLHLATFDKTAVHDFVNTSLFPKLKFIAGTDISWGYSTEKKTIC